MNKFEHYVTKVLDRTLEGTSIFVMTFICWHIYVTM